MAYDIDTERYVMTEREPKRYEPTAVPSSDLETLVALLEIAALSLTDKPGATFSLSQLIDEAREIGGANLEIYERDVRILLEKASFVQWEPNKELRLR